MSISNKSLFDRFIDEFSSVDLRSRVWRVTIIGLILCLAGLTAGYLFFNTSFVIEAGRPAIAFWKMLWMGN